MCENKELRRIFEVVRKEVTGSWRELNDEELRNFCSSPNTLRMAI
jgi:hypothetical protein